MGRAQTLELAEHAVQRRITGKPAFAWWIPHALKKRNRIIGKVKAKCWMRAHKFGVKLPKSVEEAKAFDEENGDTLWWDATCKEMKNVRPAFEPWEKDISNLPPGHQKITCHVTFDVKMGENFRQKARLVADGHKTRTPASVLDLLIRSVKRLHPDCTDNRSAQQLGHHDGVRHSECLSHSRVPRASMDGGRTRVWIRGWTQHDRSESVA
jgi:hypothetical protein